MLTTDNREHLRDYKAPIPYFGTAPEALLQGFAGLPGVEVHVVSCTQQPMSSPEKLAANVWFHSLHVSKIGWMRTCYQGCIRAVRKKLRTIQPDIVHGQGTERDNAISAISSGFPNVVTIHGNMAELARLFRARFGSYPWLAARLEDFVLRRTMGVFCNSAYTENLVRTWARKTWRVPNAIRREFFDSRRNEPDSARSCILLCVGNIIPRKRQLKLLDMAEYLLQQGHRFALHFIGRANAAERYAATFLEKLKRGPEDRIRYLGELSTNEIIDQFDAAAGLIHFPSEEAFGLVVAEALARNLKVFGARLGGIQDIVYGVPSVELFGEDDLSGLTAAVGGWISQGYPRADGAAQVMRARYHPEVIARRHVQIYQEVLAPSRRENAA